MEGDKELRPIDEIVRKIVKEIIDEEKFTEQEVKKIVDMLKPDIDDMIAEQVKVHIKALSQHFNEYVDEII